jgi:hypothetical protein
MADLSGIQYAILEVLSGQREGYLASPDAAAFQSIGLFDPVVVEKELVVLQDMGYVLFFMEEEHTTVVKIERDENNKPVMTGDTYVPILDEDGNVQTEEITQVVDTGWILTDKGREAYGSSNS